MASVPGDERLILGAPFPVGFEEGLTVATVVESALCALRNCLAFMPPGKLGSGACDGGGGSVAARPGAGPTPSSP